MLSVCRIVCLSACQCRQHAEVTPGILQSPDYPKPYPPNVMKQWHLQAPAGFRIQLKLTHVDINPSLDCSLDSLTVRVIFEPIIIKVVGIV